VEVQLTEAEAGRLRDKGGEGYTKAFIIQGTKRFPGQMGFSGYNYDRPFTVSLFESATRALGITAERQAVDWVRETLEAYLLV